MYWNSQYIEPGASNQAEASKPLSVTEALNKANSTLGSMGTLEVVGEVSEVKNNQAYKAVYFTVRDQAGSRLSCTMWRNVYASNSFDFKVGDLVELKGKFGTYAKRGDLTFTVSSVKAAGEGALRMKVALLEQKLRKEGIITGIPRHPLPKIPQRVGVVTSPAGKAVRDILRTLRRNCPQCEVLFAGVTVEGKTAVDDMICALTCVANGGAEVIILGRGGGTYEDYMPFNDEKLARAIAASPVPIVTGIGHEPDTTIADLVADIRGSNPTNAVDIAAPNIHSEVSSRLQKFYTKSEQLRRRIASSQGKLEYQKGSLKNNVLRRMNEATKRFELQKKRRFFTDNHALTSTLERDLDYAAQRLDNAIPLSIERTARNIEESKRRLLRVGSQFECNYKTDEARRRLKNVGSRLTQTPSQAIAHRASTLEALSPLSVLTRGYGITQSKDDGTVIDSVTKAKIGMSVAVRIQDGSIDCEITDINAATK